MKICPKCNVKYEDKANVCNHDGTKLEKLPDVSSGNFEALIGTVLEGRYKILSKLGQGGMGAVYKAEHLRMGRLCAIKVIPEELAKNGDAIERFDREAKMSALINDPHAVTVYDFGETKDGMYFLAMEYVEGETLSNLIRREGLLPLSRVVTMLRQMGEALAAAHQQNIVHRDLKPDNIMITRKDGHDWIKVLDFGIAKRSSENVSEDLTRAGMVIGTPLYMSPEQLSGEKLDARSDIYSLALIVYQILTGGLPFSGDNAQALMVKRLTDNPMPINAVNPQVSFPGGVEAALLSALARDRNKRTPTVLQFVEDVENGARVAVPLTGATNIHTLQLPPSNTNPNPSGYGNSPTPQPAPSPTIPPTMMPPMPVNSGPQQQQQQSGPHQQQQQGQPPYPPTVPQPYQQPYAPPSNNQQNQPAYAPMPQPAYGNTAATLGQQSLPQAQPKKSSKVVWIFGGIFIVILLIGCVAIAAFIINNSGKVDSGSAGNKDKNVQVDVDKGKTDPPSHAEVVPTDPNATALDHFNSGFKYYKAKNYTLAASEYRAALQLKPNYPEAEENLGMALYKNHDYPDAIKEFNRAVQLYGGKRSKTYEMLGRTYYNNGQYQDAYNSYLQAVTIDNNDTESMACAGFAAQMGGQTDLAAKIYDKFLEMFPNDRLANYVEAVRTGQQRPPARFEEDD